mgnify:CR=1 FL=1
MTHAMEKGHTPIMPFDEYGSPENPTLLLLHGAAATDTFCHQYVFADYWHLVVPHLPGSGRAMDRVYDPEETMADLVALIRALGTEKIVVMGHSLGGELAVGLVARHPELFSRAVFLSAWVCASDKSIRTYTRIARWSNASLRYKWLLRWQAKYWGYTPEQAAFMVDYASRITPEQYVAWFNRRIRLDELSGYASVSIPMLAVCGSKEVAEMRHSLAELGRRNSNCQTKVIEGVNHDFPLRAPERINPIVRAFLEG